MITPIDFAKWPRNYHYKYYTEALQVGYSVTLKTDVTEVLAYSRAAGRSFYGCMIYAISAAVNRLDCMKMVKMEDGNPGIWDQVHPVFTVFHKESETFSDLWTTWDPDFETFYQEYERVLARYGDCLGIKGREHQPANFFPAFPDHRLRKIYGSGWKGDGTAVCYDLPRGGGRLSHLQICRGPSGGDGIFWQPDISGKIERARSMKCVPKASHENITRKDYITI